MDCVSFHSADGCESVGCRRRGLRWMRPGGLREALFVQVDKRGKRRPVSNGLLRKAGARVPADVPPDKSAFLRTWKCSVPAVPGGFCPEAGLVVMMAFVQEGFID